ncbi:response regulator [Photobacterium leiognathi]|uniref:Putative chemotaxis protein CheY n=1 Tax=Photobacterium leiognathi lrivu.4.1 TaxID=1248232 RepID=X0NY00_PHOLE|nr:response regulator [Photobacterium leiognathi]GAD29155.1 putative chemotaxis protein CheY [Photobacterium leiognathi lrivu.4.1]
MEKIVVICVDDQQEVLSAVLKDLSPLQASFMIEECDSGEEALELMDELDAEGHYIGLVISDHVMPGKNGVELLTDVTNDSRFIKTKKILLTGQATHQDTIAAINQARIESYFEKPWDAETLVNCARTLLTEYIFDMGFDYQDWGEILDNTTVLRRLR